MILEFILLLIALAVFNWLYNRWRQLQNEKIDSLAGSLSDEEAKTLNSLLEKIREK